MKLSVKDFSTIIEAQEKLREVLDVTKWPRVQDLDDYLYRWVTGVCDTYSQTKDIAGTPIIESVLDRGIWVTLFDEEIEVPKRKGGSSHEK